MRLNLPLGKDYVPSDPWVSKVRKDGNVVSKLFIYVDDVRSPRWCNREYWNATRCFASKRNYLGIQYVPRKRKDQIRYRGHGRVLHFIHKMV